MSTAKKKQPKLWEDVKDEYLKSDKGGKPGQWSARKAQLAVQAYKGRGGEYDGDGPSQEDTDLHDWTEEAWGTKSGAQSGESGERYLPKKIRMLLTEDEYRRSTKKKRKDSHDGSIQYSDQPDDVAGKVARIRTHGPTKNMLLERASDLGISGRSSMTKQALLDAIDRATDDHGRRDEEASLRMASKRTLQREAATKNIAGRSKMTKDELVQALLEL